MEREIGINLAEKQRLRQAIDQQIQRFLRQGGCITVLPTPPPSDTRQLGSVWKEQDAAADVLD